MADLDWNNKCIKKHLNRIIIADTYFFLSLWKINNPCTLLDLDYAPPMPLKQKLIQITPEEFSRIANAKRA